METNLKVWEKKLKLVEKNLRIAYPRLFSSVYSRSHTNLPFIYGVTPTYARPVQKAELVRLCQTFLYVQNFHWIIVEDSPHKTQLVTNFLANCGVKYTHLSAETPASYRLAEKDPNWLKPKGTLQRNFALDWLRKNRSGQGGVVYFADDDNTYSLEIFEEMRYTNKVSCWPVGLVGGLKFERPITKNGKVVSWYTFWKPNRPFPMDMAGFAINLQVLLDIPEAKFDLRVQRGYQETSLLKKIITMEELEPKADSCTKVLVWHTRTEKAKLKNEKKLLDMGRPQSDPSIEV
ncbi:galactosylgalactosylxylosylprotein 3-beta-glucuronosyltransferase 3-like isoform X2 [Lineus longissimus]